MVLGFFSAYAATTFSLQENVSNCGNCFDRFSIFEIKSEMKSSTERTGCDNGSDSSGGSRKLYEQCHLLGIIDCV